MTDPGILARKAVQKNFPKFGSIRTVILYTPQSNPGYTPGGGVVPVPGTPFNVYVIFTSISAYSKLKHDDDSVLQIDKAVIIPALDVPVDLSINDEFVGDGSIWKVKGVDQDPAKATWTLWARPIGIPP